MMMARWHHAVSVAAPALILTLVLAGCAKRPATAVSTAPAPTGQPSGVAEPARADAGKLQRASADASRRPTGNAGDSAARPHTGDFAETTALKDIHFDFDKYEIRRDDARILDENARWLKANPASLLLVEGHADERGTNEYNLALGDRRAKTTMSYLVAQGVQSSRVTVISYGEERPLCAEHTEGCWARNRRAHFLVKAR